MRNVIVFALLIGGPLFYLWEHACSFRLHQDIAQLQEQRQRTKEVCDSLSAAVGSLSSSHRIEARAVALGLRPRIERQTLLVAQALATGENKSDKPATARSKTRPAGRKGQAASRPVTSRAPESGSPPQLAVRKPKTR
jgi:hypothetical protein